MKRKYPSLAMIWKLEPQERGAPHFHLLVWGFSHVELLSFVIKAWFDIAGNGDRKHFLFHAGLLSGSVPCVSKVRSWRGVWAYAAKYLGKTFEVSGWGNTWTGRFWGVLNRENIPFGTHEIIDIDYKTAVQVMRYQRRFMNMRKSKDLNSLKTFCNADHWVSSLSGLWTGQGGHPPHRRGGALVRSIKTG
jgi:hypothetical protein